MQLCTAVVVFMGFHYWTHNRIFYLKNAKNLSKNNNMDHVFHKKNVQYIEGCFVSSSGSKIGIFEMFFSKIS